MQVINLEGGPDPALQLLFPRKSRIPLLLPKTITQKKSSKPHLTRYWVIRICRSNVRSPEFPGRVKKIPHPAHPALKFWRIPLPRYL